MSWITEANKLGKFIGSYKNYRCYNIKQPETVTRYEDREDGRYRITKFIQGENVAIDKNGDKIGPVTGLSELYSKIDFRDMEKYYDRKEAKQK